MVGRTISIGMLVFAIWPMSAEAQFGGGGGRGRGGPGGGQGGPYQEAFIEMRAKTDALNALNLEVMWTVLSLGLGLTSKELDPLRGPFGTAWSQKMAVMADAEKGEKRDWKAIKDEFKDVKKDLETKIKAFLDKDQQSAYSNSMKTFEHAIPQFRWAEDLNRGAR